MKKIILFLFVIVVTFLACKKEGPGGKATVRGAVIHHSTKIPGAIVYIKYGETEFPGEDITKYDAYTTADHNANYEFKELQKGDYYLYGVGYDNNIFDSVYGGIPIKLKRTEILDTDVPVTE